MSFTGGDRDPVERSSGRRQAERTASARSYRIGQVAAATGLSPYLLRYYGRRGLIAPDRDASGRRVYRGEHLARARLLAQWRARGLALPDLRAALDGSRQQIHERIRANAEDAIRRIGAIRILTERLGKQPRRS